ncbi:MAG: tetratricopeptide repeat protein [Planctomycetota bacterium]
MSTGLVRSLGLTLTLTLLFSPGAAAQDPAWEDYARRLVDSPLEATGDRDLLAADWLALLREQPQHPLAEATLRRLASVLDELDDPRAAGEALLALSFPESTPLTPLAAQRLLRLQALCRTVWSPAEDLGADLFPAYLRQFLVLGPLGPVAHPLGHREARSQFADPGFERAHASGLPATLSRLYGEELSWAPLERSRLSPFVTPSDLWARARGQVLLAAPFDAPGGGPAWLEIESRGGGRAGPGRLPFQWSLNGAEPQLVESYAEEASAVRRVPVVLRAGRNLLVLQLALGNAGFALRLLAPDGRPFPGLVSAAAGTEQAQMGAEVDASPPQSLPQDAESALLALPARGPDTEALLGLLLCQDGRPFAGLAHLRAAAESAPERTGLVALLARQTLVAPDLPEVWQRNRVRELAESVLAREPLRLDMALHHAEVLAREDREEEAIALLLELNAAHPRQMRSRLLLQRVYGQIGLEVLAEEQLFAAQAVAPRSPDVLSRLAQLHSSEGQRSLGAEFSLQALRQRGARASGLAQVARSFAALGQAARAEELLREALLRGEEAALHAELAEFLDDTGRLAEAEAEWALAEARSWDDARAPLRRAELALRRAGQGDPAAEALRQSARDFLAEALRREPSQRAARERWQSLYGHEPTEELFAQQRVDFAPLVRAAVARPPSGDSIVKLLDHAVVQVFADGAMETLTQDLYYASDLAGCEQLGSQALAGDVLRVATLKADGRVFEPVPVNGEYVMPQLQPGDFVVTETRRLESAPADGIVRTGPWFFASTEMPFQRSSYVLCHPESLPLRLERRGPVDRYEVGQRAGGWIVHSLLAEGRARVLVEPHAPPSNWFLPWVEFGQDADESALIANLWLQTVDPTRVTPEVRAAAATALASLEPSQRSSDLATARVLYDFTQAAIDIPGGQSATQALLAREGQATWLFAALLAAADVPYELIWSRGVSPAADSELPPPFVEGGFFSRRLLIEVQPRDAQAVFCEPDRRTLPFGQLLGEASGALSLAVPSGRRCELPRVPLAQQPTWHFNVELALAENGSAQAKASARPAPGLGFVLEEQVREIPVEYRRSWITEMAAGTVPGMDVERFEVAGLAQDAEPLSLHFAGPVASLLDQDGQLSSCRLPFPPLDLSASLAGGEGVRRLPYFHEDAVVQSFVARLTLPDSLQFEELPAGLELSLAGGSYALRFERLGERELVIERRIELPPFALSAAEHASVTAFCARIDEAERARLRFRSR